MLNSLLGFTGNKEIEEVQINTNENPVSFFSDEKGESGIISAVDILCTNKGKHKIAIEMQGQKTKYFLAREQEYMAKLIANQVKEGEGKLYHEKVLETYIIVIGKDNMFVGSTKLREQSLFELDAKVMITQTNEMYPGNKMHWKFFELPKFKQSNNYKYLSKDSALKEQWLEFLIECSSQESEPDRNKIIKKGYEIMKIAKWNPDDKLLYQRQKQSEQKAKEAIEEAFEEGKLKGEISTIKTAIEWGKSKEEVMPKLKLLPKLSSEKFEECWQKISESTSEAGYESDICDTLDLVGSIME